MQDSHADGETMALSNTCAYVYAVYIGLQLMPHRPPTPKCQAFALVVSKKRGLLTTLDAIAANRVCRAANEIQCISGSFSHLQVKIHPPFGLFREERASEANRNVLALDIDSEQLEE